MYNMLYCIYYVEYNFLLKLKVFFNFVKFKMQFN